MNRSPNSNEAEAQVGTSSTQNEATKNKTSNLPSSSSTPRSNPSTTIVAPWMRLNKDHRIVRVSRAFGGKDRHSKVCTVRGLRDRRVRLSVPTAIQLYDLQDRLGLNQPSKVFDWLLDVAKDDIDQLPPLPMMPPPPGSYGGLGPMNHQNIINGANIWRPTNDGSQENKDGEISNEDDHHGKERGNVVNVDHGESSSNNFLMTRASTTNHPLFFPGILNNNNNNNPMSSYNFNNWDQSHASNFPLSNQLGGHGFTSHDFNANVLPSALSLSTGTTRSYFPSNATTDATDHRIDIQRQLEHHMHSSSHQYFSANSVYPSSQQRNATPQNLMSMITKISEPNKNHEPPSR